MPRREDTLELRGIIGTNDRLVPPGLGETYQALIPRAWLAYYHRGHAPYEGRPDAFFEGLRRFLKSLISTSVRYDVIS
jgi:pimeloyl-ACP methyl ester carboxylesterase